MDILKGKKFYIRTFGCQMNEHDSEIMAGLLTEKLGMVETYERSEADAIIVNTCSVRENADNHFFGVIGQIKKLKEKKPELIACVCGCMAQQQRIIDTLKEKYSWIDLVFGTHNIHELPLLISAAAREKRKIVDVWPEGGEIEESLPAKRREKHKAFVNIMYGCNNFCTYCIVPYTRGRERSRSPLAIEEELRALVSDGFKEVTLLGQNVNSYRGADPAAQDGAKCSFPELIRRLNAVEGLERLRFMTSHPKDLSDELIACFKDCEKLCRHIHLPVQSGSDRILKKMNRHYTREKYLETVRKLREAAPDIAITTDIIVGFPGESEEDFQETLSLCAEVCYDSAFTFIYSIRKGTPAAEYEDQVPEDIKHERFLRLVELMNDCSAKKNRAYVGKSCRVLIDAEGRSGSRRVGGLLAGRTDSFKLVTFPGDPSEIGSFADIEITDSNTYSLVGKRR